MKRLPPYQFNFEARYLENGKWSDWQTEDDCDPGCENQCFDEFVALARANDCQCECRLVEISERIIKTVRINPPKE